MSETVKLEANDGHRFDAYVAKPKNTPLAGLVVVQEIFGVNRHIRSVTDGFAQEGFYAVAPALFDRIERNVELSYEGQDMQKARALMQRLDIENAIKDVDAALEHASRQTKKAAGVVGYCYGGTLAWLSATRLLPAAAVGYYGGKITAFAQETPRVPVMLHFGLEDGHIPKSDIDRLQAMHPEVRIYWYQAGHGFNCDARGSYNPQAAKEALDRTLEFFRKHL